MISIKLEGGLGNQLFQVATTLSIAHDQNLINKEYTKFFWYNCKKLKKRI